MKRILTTLLLLGVSLVLSGCATILSKNKYPLAINSTPSEARITVKDINGVGVYSGTTPSVILLRSGAGFFKKAFYTITFEKEGYETRTIPVHFDFDPWYIGNIAFGGVLGLLVVDPATGAMWKLHLRGIDETLYRKISWAEPGLQLMELGDIPEEWHPHLVKIEPRPGHFNNLEESSP